MRPRPSRRSLTLANDSAWRVVTTNYVAGFQGACDFRHRKDAERFIELRKNSAGGRVGETWTLQRRFGGVWLRADGSRS